MLASCTFQLACQLIRVDPAGFPGQEIARGLHFALQLLLSSDSLNHLTIAFLLLSIALIPRYTA